MLNLESGFNNTNEKLSKGDKLITVECDPKVR